MEKKKKRRINWRQVVYLIILCWFVVGAPIFISIDYDLGVMAVFVTILSPFFVYLIYLLIKLFKALGDDPA